MAGERRGAGWGHAATAHAEGSWEQIAWDHCQHPESCLLPLLVLALAEQLRKGLPGSTQVDQEHEL